MSTLSIQLADSILQHAERLAQDEGVSVNQLVSSALAKKLSALDGERYLRERAVRGKLVDFDLMMSKVPDVPPQPDDELPSGYVSPISKK